MRPGSFSSLGISQLKTFATRDAMMQHTQGDAEGTLTYVSATGSLFLKVRQGWKEIQVSVGEEHLSVSGLTWNITSEVLVCVLTTCSSAVCSTSPATSSHKTRYPLSVAPCRKHPGQVSCC